MSNSNLVCYKKLSPNCTKPRNHSIDTITIHVVDGDLTVEQIGAVFAKSSRAASSNYGIDSNGRIGLYVDETNRSWCSSDRANDNRAITIEVANYKPKSSGYEVTGSAMSSLILLCTDICKRNGIEKLVWSDSKSDRINHRNGCNMTVHRDYAAKACPGDYLMSKMAYIAESVNRNLDEGENTKYNPYLAPSVTVTSKLNAFLHGTTNYISNGEGVMWLQWELARLGFYNMDIDGKCGNGTVTAIKAFQKAVGLTEDGLAGPATRKAIEVGVA